MSIEEQLDQKLDDLKEEWAMGQLPRAVSLVVHVGLLHKLYTDGTTFCLKEGEWIEAPKDGYIEQKIEEIKKGLAAS